VFEYRSIRHNSSALDGHSKRMTWPYLSKLVVGVELGLVLRVETKCRCWRAKCRESVWILEQKIAVGVGGERQLHAEL
jgi:hypothetical protein